MKLTDRGSHCWTWEGRGWGGGRAWQGTPWPQLEAEWAWLGAHWQTVPTRGQLGWAAAAEGCPSNSWARLLEHT